MLINDHTGFHSSNNDEGVNGNVSDMLFLNTCLGV